MKKNSAILASILFLFCTHAEANILEKAALKTLEKHETSKIKSKHKYFAEFDSAISDKNGAEIDPSLKIGAFVHKNIYTYIQGQATDEKGWKYNSMDYSIGLGWTKQIKKYNPFVEINYTQHNKYIKNTWKNNLGFDFGIEYEVKNKYFPFIKIDDLFNNSQSDAKAGIEYKINKSFSAFADVTVFTKNRSKYSDIGLVLYFF